MRKKCEEILLKLGITPDLKGFVYIADAVEIINSEDVKVTTMYEMVAKRRNTQWTRIERAIRHAISKVTPTSKEFIECIGDVDISKKSNGHITNSSFLYMLAYRLKED